MSNDDRGSEQKRPSGQRVIAGHRIFVNRIEEPYSYPLVPDAYKRWARSEGVWLAFLRRGKLGGYARYVIEENDGSPPPQIYVTAATPEGELWSAPYRYHRLREEMPRTAWYVPDGHAKCHPREQWPIVIEGELHWAWRRKAFNDKALAICARYGVLRHQRE